MSNFTRMALFILLSILLSACTGKSPEMLIQGKNEYLRILDLNSILSKQIETTNIEIGNNDYLVEGWGAIEGGKLSTWRWANSKVSKLRFTITDPGDKTIKLRIRPFNPPGEPCEEAEIYINDKLLESVVFPKEEFLSLSLNVPSDYLLIGSNTITFKWKYLRSPKDFGRGEDIRVLGCALNSVMVLEEGVKYIEKEREFELSYVGDKPVLFIPEKGIVELDINLPKKPLLIFSIDTEFLEVRDGVLKVRITNSKGKAILEEYSFEDKKSSSGKEYLIDLRKFSEDSVKIAFLNSSLISESNCSIGLLNPTIYSSDDKPFGSGLNNKEIFRSSDDTYFEYSKIEKPHIFIYLIDTLRADHLGCYGYSRDTSPYIDELSKDGVVFENCFATASWTKPTVASILTGIYPHKHLAQDRLDKLSNDAEILPEILRKVGYTTIYITTNGNVGEDFGFNQGNDYYTLNNFIGSDQVSSLIVSLIENNPDKNNKPIFAYIHTVDPHDPYTPMKKFLKFCKRDETKKELSDGDSIKRMMERDLLQRSDIEYIESLYDCEILQNDNSFGKFIDYLKKAKLYDDSMIIVVADHGEQFYEHGGFLHGTSIYNEEIHVPLIVKFPKNVNSGMRVKDYVTQVDILPTILEYLDIDAPTCLDGISLINTMKEDEVSRTIFIKELRDNSHSLIGFIAGPEREKVILKYPDHNILKAIRYERYNLYKDFNEKDILGGARNGLDMDVDNFKVNYFITFENPTLIIQDKTNIEKLRKETIDNLKDLGYM